MVRWIREGLWGSRVGGCEAAKGGLRESWGAVAVPGGHGRGYGGYTAGVSEELDYTRPSRGPRRGGVPGSPRGNRTPRPSVPRRPPYHAACAPALRSEAEELRWRRRREPRAAPAPHARPPALAPGGAERPGPTAPRRSLAPTPPPRAGTCPDSVPPPPAQLPPAGSGPHTSAPHGRAGPAAALSHPVPPPRPPGP